MFWLPALIGVSPADEEEVVAALLRGLSDKTSDKALPSESPEEAAAWKNSMSPETRAGAAALFSSCPTSADAAPLDELIVNGLGVDDAMGAARGVWEAKPKSQRRDTADNLRVPAYPPGRQIHRDTAARESAAELPRMTPGYCTIRATYAGRKLRAMRLFDANVASRHSRSQARCKQPGRTAL